MLDGVLGFDPLIEWMKNEGVTQDALATSLNVSQQTVSSWVNKRTRPKTDRVRTAIEVLSGGRVPRDLWLNERERAPLVIAPLKTVSGAN